MVKKKKKFFQPRPFMFYVSSSRNPDIIKNAKNSDKTEFYWEELCTRIEMKLRVFYGAILGSGKWRVVFYECPFSMVIGRIFRDPTPTSQSPINPPIIQRKIIINSCDTEPSINQMSHQIFIDNQECVFEEKFSIKI